MRINKLPYTYAAHDRYKPLIYVDARTRGRRIQHGRRTYLMDYLERRRTNQKKKRRRRSLQRRKPKKRDDTKRFHPESNSGGWLEEKSLARGSPLCSLTHLKTTVMGTIQTCFEPCKMHGTRFLKYGSDSVARARHPPKRQNSLPSRGSEQAAPYCLLARQRALRLLRMRPWIHWC